MKLADFLRDIGRPIAYYPGLARKIGGVKAAVLFCQIFYWQGRASSPLGVYKTVEELEAETGLTYEEQRAARKSLTSLGLLIETRKRLEHKVYFRIDEDILDSLVGNVNAELANQENPISPNGKSPGGEVDKTELGNSANPSSRDGQTLVREQGSSQVVYTSKITTEITTENNPLTPMSPAAPTTIARSVDNFFEQWWAAYPRQRKVGKAECKKRWKRNDLDSVAHVILAHTAAMKLSKQWKEGFEPAPLTYLNQKRWQDEVPPTEAEQTAAAEEAEWFTTTSGVDAQAARINFRTRREEEPVPVYRVHVAVASGRGPWITYVLKHAEKSGSEKFYQWVRAQLGDALLPPDDYAS
ncbi:hypothetical protein [Paraburkholderia sp. 22B1P]|uniref:hypothetical protein n=1 Tax=Paraburkholderia sp. 22B1P TaxID=3080498 RepID=UPI00308698B1|nr:helix-turn-helix domain-containing protein [Paraburkholderia sp. 22B1P]